MNDHSSGLVNDHQLLVLINNHEGDIFALDTAVKARPSEHERHNVAGLHAIISLNSSTIDMNTTGICRCLNPIARRVVHQIDQELVDTQQLLTGICDSAIMLVKFIGRSIFNNSSTSGL